MVEKWIQIQDEGRRAGMLDAAHYLRQTAQRCELNGSDGIAGGLRFAADSIERSAPVQAAGAPGRRIDLFGLIDLICLDGKLGVLGVQCCAYSGVSAHLKEIRTGIVKVPAAGRQETKAMHKAAIAEEWLGANNRLYIHGWRKVEGKWQPRIVEITKELIGG